MSQSRWDSLKNWVSEWSKTETARYITSGISGGISASSVVYWGGFCLPPAVTSCFGGLAFFMKGRDQYRTYPLDQLTINEMKITLQKMEAELEESRAAINQQGAVLEALLSDERLSETDRAAYRKFLLFKEADHVRFSRRDEQKEVERELEVAMELTTDLGNILEQEDGQEQVEEKEEKMGLVVRR
ncbi:MAG: hypothetical protein ACD_60C00019G0005 [uncultured bacterium]|nr:MAG: hypothetical protein ACD_60C00019G0005 [uncultured bacterium]